MDSKELLEKIKNDVITAKNEKAETILTDNLLKYLEEIEKDPEVITPNPEVQKLLLSFAHERSIEVSRVESEILRLKAKNIYDGKMMSAKATIILGQNAQKMAMLINGGACVAILAFLGNAVNKSGYYNYSLILSLVSFAAGVLLAAMSSGGSYITQFLYSINMEKQNENLNNNVAEKDAKVIGSTKNLYLIAGYIMHFTAVLFEILGYVAFGGGIYLAYKSFMEFLK